MKQVKKRITKIINAKHRCRIGLLNGYGSRAGNRTLPPPVYRRLPCPLLICSFLWVIEESTHFSFLGKPSSNNKESGDVCLYIFVIESYVVCIRYRKFYGSGMKGFCVFLWRASYIKLLPLYVVKICSDFPKILFTGVEYCNCVFKNFWNIFKGISNFVQY